MTVGSNGMEPLPKQERINAEQLEDNLKTTLIKLMGDKSNVNSRISWAIVQHITNRVNWYFAERVVHGPLSRYEMAAILIYWIIKLRPIWEDKKDAYYNEICAYFAGVGGLPMKITKIEANRFSELLVRLRYFTLTLDSIDMLIRYLHPPNKRE